MSRQSKTHIESDSRVELTRIGLSIAVEPACPEVLDRMVSVEHSLVTDRQHGSHPKANQTRLYDVLTASGGCVEDGQVNVPYGITMAGLEPVVRHLLEEQGCDVKSTAPVVTLPKPDLDAVRAHGEVDDGVLDLVQSQDRGLVRHARETDLAWLIGQIGLAYRDLSIVVVTVRIDEARRMAKALRRWLRNDVTLVRSGHVAVSARRVAVGTYTAILGDCLNLRHRELVIALDAVEVLGKRGLTLLNAADDARLLGLLPDNRKLAPRDADHLRGFFGFEEAHISAHGHHPLPVEVIYEKVKGGEGFHLNADVTELRRKAVWQSHDWNRRIARIARGLHGDDRHLLRPLQRVFRDTAGRRTERVAVLVENVEHGLALARKLPGWKFVTAPSVYLDGFQQQDQDLFTTATQLSGDNVPTIFTMAAAHRIDPRQIDVLIRADGGVGLPPIKEEKLMLANGIDHRLLLIDFDDRRHHELGRWTRRRRRGYRERGWYCPGADPVQERAKDFLTARPQASKA